ncbi:MAG: hypothetical protein C4530_03635 [Desulfobacteraceae bacterium]|nr:MAG: hypothetical protein C4530_03635 [Desulfobacteraceae bacterium]
MAQIGFRSLLYNPKFLAGMRTWGEMLNRRSVPLYFGNEKHPERNNRICLGQYGIYRMFIPSIIRFNISIQVFDIGGSREYDD